MIRACFTNDYYVPTRSGSLTKLVEVAHQGLLQELVTLIDPGILDLDLLYQLHTPDYVNAFLSGEGALATSQNFPWSPELRRAVLAMLAGQLTAVDIACQDGIAGHIANGFHHAHPDHGRGFCTFNGLALIAQAYSKRRVFVLDCDDHCGDGTEAFAAQLPNLFYFSIFFTRFGCRGGDRVVLRQMGPGVASETEYFAALAEAFRYILWWQPAVIIYQAGMDCHRDDPIGYGTLTTPTLYERDQQVFDFCRRAGIPVLFTLAGGYQAIERTVELHVNTLRAADETFAR